MFSLHLEGEGAPIEGDADRFNEVARRIAPDLFSKGGPGPQGIFGDASTGVISNADVEANIEGHKFFEALAKNPCSFVFRVRDYNLKKFNETANPNTYTHGITVRTGENPSTPNVDASAAGFYQSLMGSH